MDEKYIPDIADVPENRKTGPVAAIRTYRSDVAAEISQKNVSGVDIAVAEDKKNRQRALESVGISPVVNLRPFVIGGALILMLILLGAGVYFWSQKGSQLVKTTQGGPTELVFANKTTPIPLDTVRSRADLLEGVRTTINGSKKEQNSLEYLYFTMKGGAGDRILSGQEFLAAIAAHVPDALIRTLEGPFMFGVYTSSQTDSYLLFRTDSYENAYASLVQWEPHIYSDLADILSPKIQSGTTDSWNDDLLRGIAIRRLVTTTGKTVLLYGFLDKNTLVITPSDVVFYELLGRLNTPRPIGQ